MKYRFCGVAAIWRDRCQCQIWMISNTVQCNIALHCYLLCPFISYCSTLQHIAVRYSLLHCLDMCWCFRQIRRYIDIFHTLVYFRSMLLSIEYAIACCNLLQLIVVFYNNWRISQQIATSFLGIFSQHATCILITLLQTICKPSRDWHLSTVELSWDQHLPSVRPSVRPSAAVSSCCHNSNYFSSFLLNRKQINYTPPPVSMCVCVCVCVCVCFYGSLSLSLSHTHKLSHTCTWKKV